MKDFDCLGFGICAADYLCLVPEYPKLDEKTETVQFSKQGGGPVATALVTLARMNYQTAFIGKIGSDFNGQFVIEQFAEEGVNTSGIIIDNTMPTNQAFIWIDKKSGKKSIVLNGNLYRPVLEDEINFDHVNSIKYLLVDGRDTAGTFKAINWAKNLGAKIVLDAGSPRTSTEELLKSVDYPIVSQSFCHNYLKTRDYQKGVKKLLAYGVTAAVITCGADGCYGGDKSGIYYQEPFNIDVVDTTGAGDVFHGAFITGLLRNWGLPKILKFASATAALKCTKLGGREGIPDFSTVKSYLKNI